MKATKRILYSCNSTCKSLPNLKQVRNVIALVKEVVGETVGHYASECMQLVCSLGTRPLAGNRMSGTVRKGRQY